MAECERCRSVPAGSLGHQELFPYGMVGSQVQFKCSRCDALWSRNSGGDGAFEWQLVSPGRLPQQGGGAQLD